MNATPSLPHLSSLGHTLETTDDAFGFLQPANHLLEDRDALNAHLESEGYLYLKNFLDPERVLNARRSIFQSLADDGLLDPASDPMEGKVDPSNLETFALETAPQFKDAVTLKQMKAGAFRPDLAAANPAVESVVYGPELQGFYDFLFGEPALHFDYTWLRVMGPGKGTPVHCDWVYMSRGSHDLLTCWVPYCEIPLEMGGLLILEHSHRQSDRIKSYLEKDVDGYCENDPEQVQKVKEDGGWSFPGWLSQRPDSLPKRFGGRWLTAERWEPGDFITFNMRLIHGSLDNHTDRIRMSTDVRYQPASHPADERWIGANPPGHGKAGKRGRIC